MANKKTRKEKELKTPPRITIETTEPFRQKANAAIRALGYHDMKQFIDEKLTEAIQKVSPPTPKAA